MKLNSDLPKLNVCKEDTLISIFKDVPNFLLENEGECLSVQGSHQEILKGKQCFSSSTNLSESQKTFFIKELPAEDKLIETTPVKLYAKKPKINLPVGESTTELQVWSTQSDESLQEKKSKKQRKKSKKTQGYYNRLLGSANLMLSLDCVKTTEKESKLNQEFSSTDDLCNDCLWLVRLANSSKSLTSTEDDDDKVMKKWEKSKAKLLKKKSNGDYDQNSKDSCGGTNSYTEEDVLKLLDQVHSSLVESSIIITANKLKKKVQTLEDDFTEKESQNDENLLDEIQAEEGTANGTSKLCLVLGRLVSKYLKTR